MKKILSLLLSTILIFSAISCVGAAEEKTYAPFVSSFDSDKVVSELTAQTSYYTYSSQNGPDGKKGTLYMPSLSTSYGGFMSLPAKDFDVTKAYKVTFVAKKEGTESVTLTPMVRTEESNVVFTNVGMLTQYTPGHRLYDTSASVTLANVSITNEWKKYECIMDFSKFTCGSKSVVTVETIGGMQIILRGTGSVYVDNLIFEPVYEYTDILNTEKDYYDAAEMMSDNRTITSQYSVIVTGYEDKEKEVSLTGGGIGSGNGIYISAGGKDGDGALMAYGKGTDRADNKWVADGVDVTFIYGSDSYGMENIAPDTVYKFTMRAKAPAFFAPVDTSSLSDNTVYVDGSSGFIRVNDLNHTNGMIGKPLELRYTHRRNTNDQNTIGVFTGYLDDCGNYVSFNDADAELTSAVLTDEWVDYVGYFKPNSSATRWPAIRVSANTTEEGCFIIDEVSIKEIKYKDGDLVPNGDFSIIYGTDAFLYEDNASLTKDGEYGNFITVSQSDEQNSTKANKIVGLTADSEYSVSFYAKSDAANGTAYATLGTAELKNTALTLTDAWQKFEFSYTHDGTQNPELKIFADCMQSGAYAPFSVADVSILPASAPATNLFTSVEISGETNENHAVDVNFNYITDESPYYIVRISSGNDDIGYFPVFEKVVNSIEPVSYTVTKDNIGMKLLAEVFACGETVVVSKAVSDVVKGETVIEPEISSYNSETGELAASVYLENNSVTGDELKAFAFLVVTDSQNRMLALNHCDNISLAKGDGNTFDLSVNVPSAKEPVLAKIYVWRGASIFDTDMTALSDAEVYEFN